LEEEISRRKGYPDVCGICGKVNPRGVTREEIQLMTNIMSHRGPDDEGIYVDSTAGLGQRRLSVIDLASGHQPMCNEDASLWITFNGEIYNYQELRDGLKNCHRFATNSDTEVILHLYEEKREKCVEYLQGMFAFAIWDTKDKSLFLARDHLGQKPMFYVHQGDQLAFASEIKAMLAADPSLRRMNCEALHQYLTLRVIAAPRTMFAQVCKLPPGHILLFKKGHVQIRRYWHLHYDPKFVLSEQDLLDALEQKMLDTVRYHMVSDVPIGAFLSGGLDSSLVVAMMSKLSSQPVKTFSVGVPYQNYSELPFARVVAEQYQTQHFEETIYPSLVRVLPELVWHLDEPSDPLSACMLYISEMTRREVKVVLGGDGGDELFGGYDRYYGNRYVEYFALLPVGLRRHLVSRLLKLMPDGFWYKSLSHKLRWLNQLSFLEGGRRYSQSLAYFYFTSDFRDVLYGDELVRALNHFDPEEAVCGYFESKNANELVDKMLFADSMIRLPDHSVMILDRTTMAYGLEARCPFLDHKLAEFVAQIPSSLKVRGSTLRYIQVKLAERYLPRPLLERKKQGFSSALPYLLADEFRHLFKVFLSDSHLVRDGYLRVEPIRQLLAEHLGRKVDHGNRLWLLCNSEIWYRMLIEGWTREQAKDRLSEYSSDLSGSAAETATPVG
jgi:asparagine synthase (glutamine-hydrolysing)